MTVDTRVTGQIEAGLMILLGVTASDGAAESAWLAKKLAGLRIFPDNAGKMNRSLSEIGGAALVVSQFTLYGDCRKGRRPSFVKAAHPDHAEPLYEQFCEDLRDLGIPVQTGVFGAMMDVSLVNDGPVTLVVETPT